MCPMQHAHTCIHRDKGRRQSLESIGGEPSESYRNKNDIDPVKAFKIQSTLITNIYMDVHLYLCYFWGPVAHRNTHCPYSCMDVYIGSLWVISKQSYCWSEIHFFFSCYYFITHQTTKTPLNHDIRMSKTFLKINNFATK